MIIISVLMCLASSSSNRLYVFLYCKFLTKFENISISLSVHLIGLFKNHQDIHFKTSNQLKFLTFWSRQKSHFYTYVYTSTSNEFFETKESERIVFDIHLVAHFRSILFLGNQNRFRDSKKKKKEKKIRISEKKLLFFLLFHVFAFH